MSDFTPQEVERYQRHLSLPQFGELAQLKLKQARVLVIGAGGLGCPVLQYLAAAGVGKIGVMDYDYVDVSNLHRQILFSDTYVGRLKAEVAAEHLLAMNSLIEVLAIPERLSVENALDTISDYDVVVDGSDNFTTRYLVNDACVMADKPLVYGAIYTYQGQVSVFNYQGGPTYRCLFPEPPDPKDAPNCSEIGVLGVLPGLIGTLQAAEAIKVITGIGEPLSGKLLLWDMLSMKTQTLQFNRVDEVATVTELKEVEMICSVETSVTDHREIEVSEFRKWLDKGKEFQVLDIREDWERMLEKIDSFHIPLTQLTTTPVDFESVGMDPSLPTVIYCRSGVRSLKALELLKTEYGFNKIVSLKGGLLEWARTRDSMIGSSQ